MSLHLTQIRLSFGGDEVLSDVSAIVRPRDRVALVGRNGAGKTSLLRIIAGELEPEGGTMSLTGGTRVALHDQRPPLRRGVTLGDYVGEGAAAAAELEADLRRIERRMAEGDGDEATLRDYGAAQAAFERAGGYAWRSRLEGIARGLGFSPEDLERQLDTFSGGELTRASLTRALAGEPDLLLLDEPTNHLDVDSIEWLEEYLDGLDASLIFVSHDRWFLESVATSVLELERGRGRMTKGSYSHWRLERAERMAAQADQYERQQQELAHLQRFVDRFRYGTKSRQAQSKLKAMARIERVERPREQRSLKFDFPPPPRSGRVVMEAEGLSVSVAGRELVHDATLPHRARPAGGADRAQRRRQDHAPGDAAGPPAGGARPRQARPRRDARLLLTAVAGAAGAGAAGGRRRARHEADRAAGTDAAGSLPVLRRPGREAGQRALRRRAAAAGAGPDRGLGRQPAGAGRAHQPPRHREPRGARGRPRQLPRHDPVRVPRPRPDRGAGDAHHRHRGRAPAAA